MKPYMKSAPSGWRTLPRWLPAALLALPLAFPVNAHASMFHGETLDTIADVMAWVVLIVAPTVAIAVFLLIHILPEKIAERKQHPQTAAIQCLCLLSLVFGGMLWPLAWLWAFTKPVGYKLAYGTDRVPHGADDKTPSEEDAAIKEKRKLLEQHISELEAKLSSARAVLKS